MSQVVHLLATVHELVGGYRRLHWNRFRIVLTRGFPRSV